MNNKITLPALVAHLALKAGISREESELFITEFFNLLISTLSEGETVKIRELGTFKVSEVDPRKSVDVSTGEDMIIPGHRKITFIPTRELASEINAPFEMFESVELHPEALAELENPSAIGEEREAELKECLPEVKIPIEEESLPVEEKSEAGEKESEEVGALETPEEIVEQDAPAEVEEQEAPAEVEEQEASAEGASSAAEELSEEEPELPEENVPEEMPVGQQGKRGWSFVWGLIAGLVLALLVLLGVYWFWLKEFMPEFPLKEQKHVSEAVIATDSISPDSSLSETQNAIEDKLSDSIGFQIAEDNLTGEVAEEAVLEEARKLSAADEEPVYDTISKVRYLTTMAKDHYGNFNLWPYIYKENESFLGHPDRIRPGTRVVVPPLSKYNVDPSNPAHIKKAKEMGVAIYRKWGGSAGGIKKPAGKN